MGVLAGPGHLDLYALAAGPSQLTEKLTIARFIDDVTEDMARSPDDIRHTEHLCEL